MNRYLIRIILCVFTLGLISCSREPSIRNGHLMAISPQSNTTTLYYSGTIQPLKSLVITSPADGVVVEMPFQYGEAVKPGQLLFVLSSAKFLADYKAALMQYIKAKNDFNTGQSQMEEAKFLHKNELISEDDYKMKKSNFYAGQLALLQAKDTLENLLQLLNMKDVNLYNLSIMDIDKITQAMHLQMSSENLRMIAPVGGVVLAANKSEEESKKLSKGEAVKQGDVLAIIGDMQGLSVHIKVNELTINQLKLGQKVLVTGIAFPNETLTGVINRVDRQGESASNGLPTFSIEVSVANLTPIQQKSIHVGMTAKVEIDLNDEQQLMAPIVAVKEKNNESYLQVYNEKSHKIVEQLVKTGKTTADAVAILSGLHPGDRIVVPN